MMKGLVGLVVILGLAFAQKGAVEPARLRFFAAFVDHRSLIVFPLRGTLVSIDLPVELGSIAYSADGQILYGIVTKPGASPTLVAVNVRTRALSVLPGSSGFSSVIGLAISAHDEKAMVSGTYGYGTAARCGLFELDIATGKVEHIVDSMSGGCDYLSSWSHLSVSPDARRVVGTARKGQLGVINLSDHRVEKLWSGTAASWSPDGNWILATDFTAESDMTLIDTSDFSRQRRLGSAGVVTPVWSPDSSSLLLWKPERLCGGYFGTLEVLDVQSKVRSPIETSRCKVNRMSMGWVSSELVK